MQSEGEHLLSAGVGAMRGIEQPGQPLILQIRRLRLGKGGNGPRSPRGGSAELGLFRLARVETS